MTAAPMIEFKGFTDGQLEHFRRWQAVSYGVLAEVVAQLSPGVTERDATRWAMKAYRREGADRFFHLPVALLGDRTTLPGRWTTESFWPTDRVLEPGDSVVLDASPIFDGYVVDTATSCSSGPSPAHAAAMADDLIYRATILDAVRSGATFREIARSVDADFAERGDRNCHRLHPEGVLGHRVVRITDPTSAPPADPSGFDPSVLGWFINGIAAAQDTAAPSPTWSDQQISDHRPAPGRGRSSPTSPEATVELVDQDRPAVARSDVDQVLQRGAEAAGDLGRTCPGDADLVEREVHVVVPGHGGDGEAERAGVVEMAAVGEGPR